MDTQGLSQVDVPQIKLAKVGKDRDRKRGGLGWLGSRGAGSGFGGAVGGAGAGGFMGTGMSLAKLLVALLLSGVVSAGAWQAGHMMAAGSGGGKSGPKVFADKNSQKYSDTSGVIKSERSIPNSLGYVNNDGLTDEQRAAKKAAEDAAARKAAEDAQRLADEDAKKKALEDAKAASAAPAPTAAPDAAKLGLAAGKFGGMKSSFGGGLSGGAGLSGGINRNFGAVETLGGKGPKGAITAFRSPTKVASSKASSPAHAKSNSKGFAKRQLDMTNGLSRAALASGRNESAATTSGVPFDSGHNQGNALSGPGLGNGTQTGNPDNSGFNNQPNGPVGTTTPCADASSQPDSNGNCVNQTATPAAQNAAPYQGLINMVMILLGIVMALSLAAMIFSKMPPYGTGIAHYLCMMAALLGVVIAGIGARIATMTHGDFMIGGIIGVVGGFIAVASVVSLGHATGTIAMLTQPAAILVASAAGELAAASKKSSSLM